MAGANLIFKNPRTGIIKVAPTGFSWTVLLFGFLVPLHRKDWLWTAIILFSQIVTFGLAAVPFAFLYNKLYARKLIKRGYTYFSRTGSVAPEILEKHLRLQNRVFEKAFAAAE
ncbi:MAG: hypothetical protein ACLU5H_07680 [Alphaproteobacteria bacterium]